MAVAAVLAEIELGSSSACRYLSNSLGDSSVIRDCAFLFEKLPALAASGAATAFDMHECVRCMCEHAAAAVSAAAAAAAIMPVPRCFEIFAADFIVDSKGRPWLLEVYYCSTSLCLNCASLKRFQVNADPSWALWQHEQPALQVSGGIVDAESMLNACAFARSLWSLC